MIGERQGTILSLIIDSYIKNGEPIGSKTLAGLLPYKISSATIRNEMARLAELGFLKQMHTSGGRIPSNASYRYYVDNLMIPKPLTAFEKQAAAERLSVNASDPERLLKDAVSLLQQETHCTAFYDAIEDSLDCIQGVDIIPAGNGKAMIVMLSVGGKIKSSVCKIDCPVDDDFKALFYYTMREYFIGVPLSEINPALLQKTVTLLGTRLFDMLPALTSLCALCAEAAQGAVYFGGETNLLNHEELGNEVYRILSFLADRENAAATFEKYHANENGLSLFIGRENLHPLLKNTATVLTRVGYNNGQSALIGIIGSTRIDYASILPRAEYIMNTVKNYLQRGGVEFE